MQMVPVVSSNLSSVGYDSARKQLYIQFVSGEIYVYFDVPASIHEGLMNAQSHGKYHANYIKNSYPYRRLG